MNNQRIKEYYNELLAIKKTEITTTSDNIWSKSFRESVNKLVDLLIMETNDEDYRRYTLTRIGYNNDGSETSDSYTSLTEYKIKISALVSKIEAQFPELRNEKEEGVSTVFNISQTQSIEFMMQMNLDLVSRIDMKLFSTDVKLDANEKSFLEKLKNNLSKARDFASLLELVFTIGKEFSLTLEQISKLIS